MPRILTWLASTLALFTPEAVVNEAIVVGVNLVVLRVMGLV